MYAISYSTAASDSKLVFTYHNNAFVDFTKRISKDIKGFGLAQPTAETSYIGTDRNDDDDEDIGLSWNTLRMDVHSMNIPKRNLPCPSRPNRHENWQQDVQTIHFFLTRTTLNMTH